jgi:hypothetical protein
MANIVIPSAQAVLMDILPEAIGRCFFVGCCLSDSTSAISLKIYTALAKRLKRTAPTNVRESEGISISFLSKTNAVKTKILFTHCFGRNVRSRDFNIMK